MSPGPRLVIFFGMIATGKSFLAGKWAACHGLTYYNSDRVRKEIAGLDVRSRQANSLDQGIYTAEFSRKTYDTMSDRAENDLKISPLNRVVLDGSFQSTDERNRLILRFADVVEPLFVYCHCGEDVIKQRLAVRAADPDAVSDGRWDIYLKQKKRFELADELDDTHLVVLETDDTVENLLVALDREIALRG